MKFAEPLRRSRRGRQGSLDHQPHVAELVTRELVDVRRHELTDRQAEGRDYSLDLATQCLGSQWSGRHEDHCTDDLSQREPHPFGVHTMLGDGQARPTRCVR